MTSQEEEEEEVRKHLHLSAGDDVTVECVAYNEMGESRHVFKHRKSQSLKIHLMTLNVWMNSLLFSGSVGEPPTFLTPALVGALGAAGVLLLLLLVVSYKWKQVRLLS